ncbi:MAG: IMP dehydrogenase, partial [Chlamydiia bacterium]|nr:IMP dehydrogenase [Chlamydiia bacterium]
KYRGQASADFQNDFYGGLKEKTVAEGIDFWAPVSGPAKDLIEQLLGGIRSGLTYGGARNFKELQRKAEFVEVSTSYIHESKPRHA